MIRIPIKFQIFDSPVELSEKDASRLKVHLTGWNKLNEVFLLGLNEPDLRRMVVMELMDDHRRSIISRLLGRLAKMQRQKYLQKISKALT
tara:strand:+ start:4301 stop:4570 length:270 start_codon:yes stop_codon:yes gene_type:complete